MPDAASETEWRRCGNTPFYRRSSGPFPASFYTDPFNWTQISVGGLSIEGADEGSFSALYRRAPGYDWDAVRSGIPLVSSDREKQLHTLRAVHEWAIDLMKAKEALMPFREIRKIFEAAPKEDQEAVLEAVGALLQPDPMVEINLRRAGRSVKDRTILIVLEGSPAQRNLAEVRTFYPQLDRVIVAESAETGLDEALAHFGIYECG